MPLPTSDDDATVSRYVALGQALHARFPGRLAELDCGPRLGVKATWVTVPTSLESAEFAAVVAAWDWTPRRARPLADLLAAVQALPLADRNKLLALAAADLLQRRPGLARAFGVALDGDEPA